jgi:regulator of replication initiation timing
MHQPNSDEASLIKEYISILQTPSLEDSKKLSQLLSSKPIQSNVKLIRIFQDSIGQPDCKPEHMNIVFSYGSSRHDRIKLNRKLITSLVFFHKSFTISGNEVFIGNPEISFNSFDDFFKPENSIFRIVLAILCDNAFALKFLFDEYQSVNKNKSLMDLITEFSLVGIAAANGCTEVIKHFISMNVNFEQKSTIHLEKKEYAKDRGRFNEKSVLNSYESCSFDMTPLALALSAAPAMPREDATKLIELFLNANANYNNKIIKRWTAVHGYHGRETQEPRSKPISLFEFDQTGILDELVKKKREHKPVRSQIKHGEPQQKREVSSEEITILSLKAELDEVKEENKALKTEVSKLWAALRRLENTLGNKEPAGDFNSAPPEHNNSSQQFFRGRGHRGRRF